MTVDEAKLYLRIDGDDENELIEALIASADSYLKMAVDDFEALKADKDFKSLSDMVEKLLISELYENRGVGADSQKDYSYSVRSMITQLQNWTAADSLGGETL